MSPFQGYPSTLKTPYSSNIKTHYSYDITTPCSYDIKTPYSYALTIWCSYAITTPIIDELGVMSRYEQLWAIGIFICCTFAL